MSTYKITNITNLLGKRDYKQNSVLDIEYVDEMLKKTIKLKAGDSLYLTVPTLPLSIHRLRVKKLITVTEVSPSDVEKLQTPQSKQQQPLVKEDASESDDESKKAAKKKVVKKH